MAERCALMDYRFAVQVEMNRSVINISGMPLKYAWNEDLVHLKSSRPIKGFALVNPSNLECISLILDDRCVRIDAIRNINFKDCVLFVEEDFWHSEWARLQRRGKRYKKYNEEQKPFKIVRQHNSQITLAKK